MLVQDVMSRRPLTLDADDNVGLAAETMRWAHVRHLPVLRGRSLVGMLSEHDVLTSLLTQGDLAGSRRPVGDIMSSPVQAIAPGADAREAATRMAAKGIHCLPVVDDGRLVGIVTPTDVLAPRAVEPAPATELRPSATATPDVLVRDLMRAGPEVARSADLVLDAAARMAERDIRHLPIVDEQDRVIGMLSDRDVRRAVGSPYRLVADAVVPEAITSLTVGAIMSSAPVTVRGEAHLDEVARLFAEGRIGAVPVVDDHSHLIGIVSYVDVLRVFSRR